MRFITLNLALEVIKIEYVYASLILHYAQKPVTEENIKKILEAAGVTVDEVRVKALTAALKEVNIDDAINAATLTVPTTAPSAATPVVASAEPKKEDKKKKEEKEEEVAEGLAALFG